jgi:hypothetical protein
LLEAPKCGPRLPDLPSIVPASRLADRREERCARWSRQGLRLLCCRCKRETMAR